MASASRPAQERPGDQREQLGERRQPDVKGRPGQLVHLKGHRDRGQLVTEHGDELARHQPAQVAGAPQRSHVDEQPPPVPGRLMLRALAHCGGPLKMTDGHSASYPTGGPGSTRAPRRASNATACPRPPAASAAPADPMMPGSCTPPSGSPGGPRAPRGPDHAGRDTRQHARSLPFCFRTRDNRATDRNDCDWPVAPRAAKITVRAGSEGGMPRRGRVSGRGTCLAAVPDADW